MPWRRCGGCSATVIVCDEPDRGLGAGPLGIGEGAPGLRGGRALGCMIDRSIRQIMHALSSEEVPIHPDRHVKGGPDPSRSRARTGSGDVRVDGVTGAVEARTGSGSMELTAVGGDVDVQSGGWAYRQAREISRFCRRTGLPVRPRPASSCQPDAPEPVSNLVG